MKTGKKVSDILSSEIKSSSGPSEYSWPGILKEDIPVFIHDTILREVNTGELFYLNKKEQKTVRKIRLLLLHGSAISTLFFSKKC